ncbi:MAG: hypothetical protein GX591_14595 [Planctomycetes bacterium]|mgnify:CR=1 FL=1|nr:hypothetical protein [Planctomycetota bacterium]
MTSITLTNTDAAILADLAAALRGARLEGEAVFAEAAIGGGRLDARLAGPSPKALVHYKGTRERPAPEERRACAMTAELTVLARLGGGAEAAGVASLLGLLAAARNAVAADPPQAACCAYGDDGLAPALRWGSPQLDPPDGPWGRARIEVEVAYMIDSPTDH